MMSTFRHYNQIYYQGSHPEFRPSVRNYIISGRISELFIFAHSKMLMLDTVIFDMDGLLIDSEPLWQKAGMQTLTDYGISITLEQYHQTTGLRTPEWIEWWFSHFKIPLTKAASAISTIEAKAISLIDQEGLAFPGTDYILQFFRERGFKIGLATSSPTRLVEVVVRKLGISTYFNAYSSAEFLSFGKPHPEVYMNCAAALSSKPADCLCFEDSFNGMIAAKAAKMKCVVVPARLEAANKKWNAADLQLSSLQDFTDDTLKALSA